MDDNLAAIVLTLLERCRMLSCEVYHARVGEFVTANVWMQISYESKKSSVRSRRIRID